MKLWKVSLTFSYCTFQHKFLVNFTQHIHTHTCSHSSSLKVCWLLSLEQCVHTFCHLSHACVRVYTHTLNRLMLVWFAFRTFPSSSSELLLLWHPPISTTLLPIKQTQKLPKTTSFGKANLWVAPVTAVSHMLAIHVRISSIRVRPGGLVSRALSFPVLHFLAVIL